MKKMKIAGLLLACALPLSANAADVCLSINNGVMLVKFKKPSVAKGTYNKARSRIVRTGVWFGGYGFGDYRCSHKWRS